MSHQLTRDEKRHRENYRRSELREALERLKTNQERIEEALAETGGSDLALMEVVSAIQHLLAKKPESD